VGGDRPGGTTAQHDRLPGHGSRHGGADDDSRSSPLSSGDFIPPECSLEPLARHVERGSQETNSSSVSQETCTGVVFGRWEPSSNAGHRHKHPDLQQGGVASCSTRVANTPLRLVDLPQQTSNTHGCSLCYALFHIVVCQEAQRGGAPPLSSLLSTRSTCSPFCRSAERQRAGYSELLVGALPDHLTGKWRRRMASRGELSCVGLGVKCLTQLFTTPLHLTYNISVNVNSLCLPYKK
jgi:hypothetical protein